MIKSVKMAFLDDKDILIVSALKANGRFSSQQIAKITKLPLSTVHNRIKKMETSGAIKGYTVLTDDKKTGMIAAYVLIGVNYHPSEGELVDQYELAKKIKSVRSVEEVSMTTGTSDIIIKVRARGIDELNDLVTKQLRNFKGVDKTQTLVVLNSI
jgi:DNA-binding Lrp family transcriptional regulator